MPDILSISKQNPAFPDYLNFESLRAIGIDHLQQMSGKLWTDYNLHDPGVTILEVLCYAVTDLGYRTNLDIQDLLARSPEQAQQEEDNFFTPDQILTCNPVTELDVRKRLLDIEGVRNAWIETFQNYHLVQQPDSQQWLLRLLPDGSAPSPEHDGNSAPSGASESASESVSESISKDAAPQHHLKGLYTVLLDLEPPMQRDGCGQFYEAWSTVLDEVKAVLHSYRNLCEDVHELIVLGEEAIGLRGTIELDAGADAREVLVEIFVRVQNFLAPHVPFHTLQDLLERGKSPAEIFAGRPSAIAHHDKGSPYAYAQSHGFIDTEELEAFTLPTQLHTSDLYRLILDIPGVQTINTFSIRSYIGGLPQSQEEPWYLDLTPNYRPVLGIEQTHLTLLRGGLPTRVDLDWVRRRYAQQKSAYLKARRSNAELDLPVPQGTHYEDLADHYSIHHDFPLTYGISEDGLPASVPARRKAQANQLKGYLVFFDQVLANYLVQLSHARELFSWKQVGDVRTYFTQMLDFPGVEEILPPGQSLAQNLNAIFEDKDTAVDRRNRFLDHMLARFAESFTDYVLLNYRLASGDLDAQDEADIIRDKTNFLADYPLLSRDRFRAADYCCQNTEPGRRISGFEKRISRLLGIEDLINRSLVHYQVPLYPSRFTLRLGGGAGQREGDRPLLARQTYATLADAQNALDTLLECIPHPSCYQRFIYRNAYHSLEVVDEDGTSLVFYDHAYPTAGARDAALVPLIERIRIVSLQQNLVQQRQILAQQRQQTQMKGLLLNPFALILQTILPVLLTKLEENLQSLLQSFSLKPGRSAQRQNQLSVELQNLQTELLEALQSRSVPVLQDHMISFDQSEQGVGFVLKVDPTHQPQLRFVSAQRYSNRDAARAGAAQALEQIQTKTFYHPISLRPSDVDPTMTVDGKLTSYGFAVLDDQRKILADMDSSLGFSRDTARDGAIASLQTGQSTFQIEETAVGFGFSFRVTELDNPQAGPLIMRSPTAYPTETELWEAVQALTAALRRFRCYELLWEDGADGDRTYRLRINDGDGRVLAISDPRTPTSDEGESDRLIAFAWINSISPYLLFEEILQEYSDEAIGYRFQVFDRRRHVLLEGTQCLALDAERNHFYRDVLGVLWEDGAIAPTQSDEGYSFAIVTPLSAEDAAESARSELAHHPHFYRSEAERNQAIQRLKVLLQTAHINTAIQQTLPAYGGRVVSRDEQQILLQSTQRFTYGLAQLQVVDYGEGNQPSDAFLQQVRDLLAAGRSLHWQAAGDRWESLVNSITAHLWGSEAETPRSIQLEVRYLDDDDPSQSGYRFFLTPSHPPANQPWQFTGSLLYRTHREAELEGDRAKGLLQNSNIPTVRPPTSPIPPTANPASDPALHLLQRQLRNLEYTLVLLDPHRAEQVKAAAWEQGNGLMRLAEIDDSFRRIDPQHQSGLALYGWALSGRQQYSTLATHPSDYLQEAEREQSIQALQADINDEGFHVIEHILLRPRQTMMELATNSQSPLPATLPIRLGIDPYSFWMSIVLPAWPKRFQDRTFRQFVERTLRLEAPAHVVLKIAWVDVDQMHRFELAYQAWLEQLSQVNCDGEACHQTHALNDFIQTLSNLRGVYPVASLADPEALEFTQNPVILDQTPLGTIHD
ncbi:MAG: hypothetical protein VKK04_10325 [Synechococcales bacterium]|nr:hypothetical protein [Synechococcales bacterium]